MIKSTYNPETNVSTFVVDAERSVVNAARRAATCLVEKDAFNVKKIDNESGTQDAIIISDFGLLDVPRNADFQEVVLEETNTGGEAWKSVGPTNFKCYDKDKRLVENPWKDSPIVSTRLRFNETIRVVLDKVHGIGKTHAKFIPVSIHWKEIDKGLLQVTIRGRGGDNDPRRPWNDGIVEVQKRLEHVVATLTTTAIDATPIQKLRLHIPGEDSTLGELISEFGNKHPDVERCGYNNDQSAGMITVDMVCRSGLNCYTALIETIREAIIGVEKVRLDDKYFT